jgi:hypothetical protein
MMSIYVQAFDFAHTIAPGNRFAQILFLFLPPQSRRLLRLHRRTSHQVAWTADLL